MTGSFLSKRLIGWMVLVLLSYSVGAQTDSSRAKVHLSIGQGLGAVGMITEGYHLIAPQYLTYLMLHKERFYVGAFVGGARSFSSHNESLLADFLGLRMEYWFLYKREIELSLATELFSNVYAMRTLDGGFKEEGPNELVSSQGSEWSLPVSLGGRLRMNKATSKHLDVYWAPVIGYKFGLSGKGDASGDLNRLYLFIPRFTFDLK